MTGETRSERAQAGRETARRWAARLDEAGLSGLIDAMRPLAPAAAQVVWLIQPVFALFDRYRAAGDLAEYWMTSGTAAPAKQRTDSRRGE